MGEEPQVPSSWTSWRYFPGNGGSNDPGSSGGGRRGRRGKGEEFWIIVAMPLMVMLDLRYLPTWMDSPGVCVWGGGGGGGGGRESTCSQKCAIS